MATVLNIKDVECFRHHRNLQCGVAHRKWMFCTVFLNLVTWGRSVKEAWNKNTEGTEILSDIKFTYHGLLDFRLIHSPRQSTVS